MVPPQIVLKCEQQRGVIARFQLVAAMKPFRADNLLKTASYEQLERGIHRVVGGARLPIQAGIAAALRARPQATLTGPVILGHYGVDGFADSELFEVLTTPGRRLRGVAFRHRTDPDPARPVARLGDVRIAGPMDALIDSAVFVDEVGERTLRVAYDWLRWNDLVKTDAAVKRIEQLLRSSPGAPILYDVLEAGGGAAPESEGERALWPLLRCFDPPPELQVWVTPRYRPDVFFRGPRVAGEYLGDVDHAYAAERAADAERDGELTTAGVRVFYVIKQDLGQPQALLARVAGLLALRAQELQVTAPVLRHPLPDTH